MKRLLVAGVGNIFFGDDAFGVEVARALGAHSLPEWVEVKDFGIRGYDLACAITGDYDAIILIDAVRRGSAPGTLLLIEPELDRLAADKNEIANPHSLEPAKVLQLADSFGGIKGKVYLVGCEPAQLENEEEEGGLSGPAAAAVPRAVELVQTLISELSDEEYHPEAGLAAG